MAVGCRWMGDGWLSAADSCLLRVCRRLSTVAWSCIAGSVAKPSHVYVLGARGDTPLHLNPRILTKFVMAVSAIPGCGGCLEPAIRPPKPSSLLRGTLELHLVLLEYALGLSSPCISKLRPRRASAQPPALWIGSSVQSVKTSPPPTKTPGPS
jgi:hypothetical protein